MNIEVYPKRVFANLLYFIFFLLFADVFGIISKFYFGHGRLYGLISLFNFDIEANIPSFFSVLILLIISLLLAFIALIHKKENTSYFPWLSLSLIFMFLSIDEGFSIHENISILTRNSLQTSGIFYYAWVIPYGIAVIALVIFYLKFIINLPKRIMILFILSGAIFVSGAIGFELLGGRQAELFGENNIIYAMYYTCEEFFEMLGTVTFIYALLLYMACQFKTITGIFKE